MGISDRLDIKAEAKPNGDGTLTVRVPHAQIWKWVLPLIFAILAGAAWVGSAEWRLKRAEACTTEDEARLIGAEEAAKATTTHRREVTTSLGQIRAQQKELQAEQAETKEGLWRVGAKVNLLLHKEGIPSPGE